MTIAGEEKYFDGYRERTAKVGKCKCGEEVTLICLPPLYACECPNCGQYYNACGQELKRPEQWEESIDEDW